MSIITKVLKQKAVYWPPGVLNKYGQAGYGPAVELDVRWDNDSEEIITTDGTKILSKAQVMVSEDVEIEGVLWYGTLATCQDISAPKNNDGAYEIMKFTKNPNFKCTEFLRIAYL